MDTYKVNYFTFPREQTTKPNDFREEGSDLGPILQSSKKIPPTFCLVITLFFLRSNEGPALFQKINLFFFLIENLMVCKLDADEVA